MNMHVLIVVYYAIIKMVIGKHLMSGKIFYDILGWGQFTCSFSNQPPSFSALSHLLGNSFLTCGIQQFQTMKSTSRTLKCGCSQQCHNACGSPRTHLFMVSMCPSPNFPQASMWFHFKGAPAIIFWRTVFRLLELALLSKDLEMPGYFGGEGPITNAGDGWELKKENNNNNQKPSSFASRSKNTGAAYTVGVSYSCPLKSSA